MFPGGVRIIAQYMKKSQEVVVNVSDLYGTSRLYWCACTTLVNLKEHSRILCRMKSIMQTIVTKLLCNDELLIQVSSRLLFNLAMAKDLKSKKTLRKTKTVSLLMQAAMSALEEDTLKYVLYALHEFDSTENLKDICAVGGLKFLIKFQSEESPFTTDHICSNILRNIVTKKDILQCYATTFEQPECLKYLLTN